MLDDPPALRKADPGGMIHALESFPRQVAGAILAAKAASLQTQPVERVVVCGMGGSGMAGEIVAAWLGAAGGPLPVFVHHDYGVPAFVDSRTLVVPISYSGDTEETLDAFEEAHRRESALFAVSVGGELGSRAEERGVDCITIGSGLQPRAAVGALTISLALALERWGAAPGAASSCEAVAKGAQNDAKRFGLLSPQSENEAKQLAREISDRTPVGYGAGPYAVVARRFANEVSENAKRLAFSGSVPEACHNDLVGIAGDDLSRFAFVLFHGPESGASNRERLAFLSREAQRRRAIVAERVASGEDLLANLFHLIHLGDWASVYAALLAGVDPTPVEVIDRLKNEGSRGTPRPGKRR